MDSQCESAKIRVVQQRRAKAETEVARQQHFNDAEEYRKYLALVSEGRDVVFDPEVSVRWDECAFVRDRLAR